MTGDDVLGSCVQLAVPVVDCPVVDDVAVDKVCRGPSSHVDDVIGMRIHSVGQDARTNQSVGSAPLDRSRRGDRRVCPRTA